MTGWVGDPTTGATGLPSPPMGGPQPLVQQRRPLALYASFGFWLLAYKTCFNEALRFDATVGAFSSDGFRSVGTVGCQGPLAGAHCQPLSIVLWKTLLTRGQLRRRAGVWGRWRGVCGKKNTHRHCNLQTRCAAGLSSPWPAARASSTALGCWFSHVAPRYNIPILALCAQDRICIEIVLTAEASCCLYPSRAALSD
jgi:hypothetical protein